MYLFILIHSSFPVVKWHAAATTHPRLYYGKSILPLALLHVIGVKRALGGTYMQHKGSV